MNFTIKDWEELTKEELYQLLQLRSEVFVVEQECAYQDIDDTDRNAKHIFILDGAHRFAVAYARVYETEIDQVPHMAIGRVCIKKPSRGQGLARLLMEQALQYVQHHSDAPTTVSAQSYLERFYLSLGFRTMSEPYLEDGIPHIRMIRES